MADPVEILPLLVVALLLMTANGQNVEQMEVVVDGDHAVTELEDTLVVGGGTATVPEGETVSGTIYVIGGDFDVAGRVEGDVVQLAGNLSVRDGAAIAGELRRFGGQTEVADGATIASRSTVPVVSQDQSPAGGYGFLVVRALVLGVVAALVVRRWPAVLRNVGDAIRHHSVVSLVVGGLTSATFLALFVFMAFTLILLPVSLVGLFVGFLTLVYGYVAYGYLLGALLPIERADLASGVGTVGFVVVTDLLGRVPVVGSLVEFALALTGLGAVVVTYYGLREFEPALAGFSE